MAINDINQLIINRFSRNPTIPGFPDLGGGEMGTSIYREVLRVLDTDFTSELAHVLFNIVGAQLIIEHARTRR